MRNGDLKMLWTRLLHRLLCSVMTQTVCVQTDNMWLNEIFYDLKKSFVKWHKYQKMSRTCQDVRVVNNRSCNVWRHYALEPMLLNLRAICGHFLPHVGDFVGTQRVSIRQRHTHNQELVFTHRLDHLTFLNQDIDVGWCHRRECPRWWPNPKFIRSCSFDLKQII